MKKLMSLLLCVFLILTALTACGKEATGDKTQDKAKDKTESKPRPIVEDNSAVVTIGANGELEVSLNAEAPSWDTQIDLLNRLYGLDKITLYPARLNSDASALINRQSPLQFPKYGADGRVTELDKNTLVGAYDADSGDFISSTHTASVGVLGIGQTASMSKRAFAIMNGKTAIASGKSAATNSAKDAIRLYGGKLAAIALQYQNDDGTGVVVEADIAVLKDLIATLDNSANNISESMKAAVQVALAADADLTDDEWAIAAGLADGKTIVEYIAALDVTVPSEVSDLVADYQAVVATLTAAKAALPEYGDGNWGDIKDAVNSLLTVSNIRIGSYTIAEIQASYKADGMGSDVTKDLFNKVSDGSLTYSFTGGIFTDIADLTGNYTSSMAFLEGTTVEGLDLNMLGSKPVNVEGSNGSTGSLGALAAADVIVNAQAPTGDDDAAKPLTDVFGYIVDLLFRTNATESDLLLQVEPINRYGEGAVDEIEGDGSNITFTVNDEYTKEKIEGLSQGIRVVFFDNTGAILAVAALDADGGELSDDTYKLDLYLQKYTINADGVISITGPKADNKICALPTNAETAVSALVYLDGDVIDNSHAGVQTGLEMTLDLQFSSSVEKKSTADTDLLGE